MAPPQQTWKDYVWLAWLVLQVPIILCIDAVDFYPEWLCVPKDSPLHFLWTFKEGLVAQTNDPILGWTPDSHMTWVPLFMWIEFLVQFPIILYTIPQLAKRRGTTGPLELLMMMYGFIAAFTCMIIIEDISRWDAKVYSPEQKNYFRYQVYAPWFVIPGLMFVDMYGRLLARLRAVDTVKKTQ